MLKQVRDALTAKLAEEFKCSVYTEYKEYEQQPYFIVTATQVEEKRFINGRKQLTYPITISYKPLETGKTDTSDFIETLYKVLKSLDMEGVSVVGTHFKSQMKDGLYKISIQYSLFVYEVDPDEPRMESFTMGGKQVKESTRNERKER